MSKYAVLGATGNTGTALIQNLMHSEDNQIHAFCRNRQKFENILPEAFKSPQVRLFEGNINDIALLTSCVHGCRAVFIVVSTNDNVPGYHVGQDIATNLLLALRNIKHDAPKLVLLSSATVDEVLSRRTPYILRRILLWSASNVYNDLLKAEAILRKAQDDGVKTIFIKPGALAVDVQRGHALSFTEESSPLSYLDLAAGMIEAADDATGRYDMHNVGVINVNGRASFPSGTPLCILMGLLRHFFPFLHPYLPSTGPA